MEVVIIGGGIVGLSTAHYVADRGADVTLYEQGSLGTGSTARAAGGIRSQFSTPVNVELSLASKRVWDAFEAEFGVDIGLRKTGYLFLARSEATAERFRENVRTQRDRGAESEYLAPAEAVEHCPGLDPEPFVGASYNPDDGVADPNLAVQGYAAAAREGGVDVRVAALAGVDLPISPRRRRVAVVAPSRSVPPSVPLTIDLETGSYFRPEGDRLALVGGHFGDPDPEQDPDDYDDDMDLAWATTAVERAAAYTTYFGPETRIRRGWAGLYAVTPDHHPVIEESVPGLVTAAGFSGHGFQHAPATGQVVADIVHDDEPQLVDVSMLDADRFERGEGLDERNVA
ncbi:FAD-dependent oxidoreductase [Halobacteriales archaeon QH_10_70_21]|nr:MAG: FAD-dependent oxidoreductase [Halobacteriales archaeon QH_10_70_21]